MCRDAIGVSTIIVFTSVNDDFLCSNRVAFDEAEDVNTGRHSHRRDAIRRVTHASNNDAPQGIHHLQRHTVVRLNRQSDFAVGVKGKRLVRRRAVCWPGKQQSETRSIVIRISLESVVWIFKKINIGPS